MMNDSNRQIWMVDTTLRDGEQAPGVVFRPLERIVIAQELAACGIDEIEAGIPAMGRASCREISALARLGLPCTLSSWCRAVKKDIELASDCRTPGVHISFPTSSILLRTFDKTEGWVLERLEELVRYARGYFDRISVGAQDATRTDPGFLRQFAGQAKALEVHRLRIADTVGLATPSGVMGIISSLAAAVPGLDLEFHGHNDLGMATANAVSAVDAGARALSVTVNGLGERAGNAPLEETAMALFGVGARRGNIRLSGMAELCRTVSRFSGRSIPPDKPIVGARIFSHESGIHCAGILKNPDAYEPFAPGSVGRRSRQFVIGSHAGGAVLRHVLRQRNILLDKTDARRLLPRVRQKALAANAPISPGELERLYKEKNNGL